MRDPKFRVWELPRLYAKDSRGNTKWWEIKVFEIEQGVQTDVTWAGDGKKEQTSTEVIQVGKNLGKANETTPWDQAVSEATATWKKKQDKGYSEKETNELPLLPMLAHKYIERKKDIKFPAYAQRKLDGMRVIIRKIGPNTILYLSREGKAVKTVRHLDQELLRMMQEGEIWDGEIYKHGWTFQEIMKRVRKIRPEGWREVLKTTEDPENPEPYDVEGSDAAANAKAVVGGTDQLEIHIFDKINQEPFEDRYDDLSHRFWEPAAPITEKLKLVFCYEVADEDEIMTYLAQFEAEGYEGIIIRNKAGLYKLKDRSKDLQKLKNMKDEEYEIIGGRKVVITHNGEKKDTLVLVCKVDDEKIFEVRPAMTFEEQAELLAQLKNLIGKKLTVQYQELTDDGIPRFPIGKAIRDYE